MQRTRAAAAENKIAVCLGISDNHNNPLNIAQAIIGVDGEIKMRRGKLKSTRMERAVFGDATALCDMWWMSEVWVSLAPLQTGNIYNRY